ncbi:unnamed protein product [Acanthoscelides obtectus]|uniref:Uncharacterized protein n=1 Tax=Acanthoscelides obtectus TaxID=200917 RepID=A0A9P0MIC9_ACAOB|nr:unnamed protein product [Acanthoscelides obtectus]CAK1645601.1 hypothetical protein AOBTE_LOCUS14163 [Acanthoscelides obtectus]
MVESCSPVNCCNEVSQVGFNHLIHFCVRINC